MSIYKPTPGYAWSFGHCSVSIKWLGSGTYTDKCCIPEGQHILRCSSGSTGKGDWSNAVVMMLGHQFCDDFVGHTAFIPLNVSGMLHTARSYPFTYAICLFYQMAKILLDFYIIRSALRSSPISNGQENEIHETAYAGKLYCNITS